MTPPADDASGTSAVLFCGDDYLADRGARDLVHERCPPEQQALGLETVSGDVNDSSEAVSAINDALEALHTGGLLGGAKVVWIRRARFIEKSFRASEELKKKLSALRDEIRRGLDPHMLVISAGAVDGRSALVKALREAEGVRDLGLPDKPYKARPVVVTRARAAAKNLGLRLPEPVAERLVDQVGLDSGAISSELQKLDLYLGERREVRTEDIGEIVTPSRELLAWDLEDALGDRRLDAALAVLDRLRRQGVQAVALMMSIENRLRILRRMRDCLDQKLVSLRQSGPKMFVNWSEGPETDRLLGALAEDPRKIHWFRAQLLFKQARHYRTGELNGAMEDALQTHERLVMSGRADPYTLIELLLVRIMSRRKGEGDDAR
ncbi:DNA polymerase III subunit delta [Kiritimatiella glycovorans]|uniref:DNA-directed DNA polymerase n=1 Tax=Kiritimatiella glycovorans TaxID=1307763 RepID=A0A0G3EG12_9BACT|nr:hypothetical protein [Kiritimatiella glycovorans]AKJ64312.1 DNA polymerase III subunit delta [Kiritimatiella glycovorans]